jgi:hypothetical protein
VNFNVNFNILLTKYIVHLLVKIKKILLKKKLSLDIPGKFRREVPV